MTAWAEVGGARLIETMDVDKRKRRRLRGGKVRGRRKPFLRETGWGGGAGKPNMMPGCEAIMIGKREQCKQTACHHFM